MTTYLYGDEWIISYCDRIGDEICRGTVTGPTDRREVEAMAAAAMALPSCASGTDHAVVWNAGTTLAGTGVVLRPLSEDDEAAAVAHDEAAAEERLGYWR